MKDIAVMTVEVQLVDKGKAIAIGGPPDRARAMRSQLANEMNIPLPEGDTVLQLALESQEVAPLLGPILNNFSDVGWCFIDRRRAGASLVPGPTIDLQSLKG